MPKRVAVIGSGMAGLCAARHVLQTGMSLTIFEQNNDLGGTWIYTDKTGKDEFGLDIHTSMYKGLYTNLPKEVMGFPDFPFPDQAKSFIPSDDVLSFLNLYATNFNIQPRIKFQHYVIRIRPIADEWEIIVKDLPNDRTRNYMFDYVMVCNGNYHTPSIPVLPGHDIFQGKQIHSHDYRSPEKFKDETVLIIGARSSGLDLTVAISQFAKQVDLSHHLPEKRPAEHFASNVNQRPDVTSLTRNGVKFSDGIAESYSTIVYCTGYRTTFPFLSVDCGIFVDDNFVQSLYKHCINMKIPTMALIGLPFLVCPSQMFDMQVRFVMKFFSGALELPSMGEMMADTDHQMQDRWKRGYTKRQAHMLGPDQVQYFDDLSKTAQIENVKPVIQKLYLDSRKMMASDLRNYRKNVYKVVDDKTFIIL